MKSANNLKKRIILIIDKNVNERLLFVKDKMKENIAVKTGLLRDSVTIVNIDKHTFRVGIDSAMVTRDSRNMSGYDYSTNYNDGTKPYSILPVNAQALAFIPKNSSELVFAKRVNMPAREGKKFIEQTMEDYHRRYR